MGRLTTAKSGLSREGTAIGAGSWQTSSLRVPKGEKRSFPAAIEIVVHFCPCMEHGESTVTCKVCGLRRRGGLAKIAIPLPGRRLELYRIESGQKVPSRRPREKLSIAARRHQSEAAAPGDLRLVRPAGIAAPGRTGTASSSKLVCDRQLADLQKGNVGHPRLRTLHLMVFCRAVRRMGRHFALGRVRFHGRPAAAGGCQQLKSLFPAASASLLYL
jgi:hypothetical protein